MAENLKLDINYKAIDPIDQNIASIINKTNYNKIDQSQ